MLFLAAPEQETVVLAVTEKDVDELRSGIMLPCGRTDQALPVN
ncbi:MAG: hypothetical protein ACRD3C_10805 [Vicinamibacterales bacterium]